MGERYSLGRIASCPDEKIPTEDVGTAGQPFAIISQYPLAVKETLWRRAGDRAATIRPGMVH